MKMVQVILRSGATQRTCWVEDKVKVGNHITLKSSEDPDRLWDVLSVSEPKDSSDIKSDWNVGGVTSRR